MFSLNYVILVAPVEERVDYKRSGLEQRRVVDYKRRGLLERTYIL